MLYETCKQQFKLLASARVSVLAGYYTQSQLTCPILLSLQGCYCTLLTWF